MAITSEAGAMTATDAIDRRIIAELRVDARQPVMRIAGRVGISRSTAEKRIARMIERGVILGFTVRARDDLRDRKSVV